MNLLVQLLLRNFRVSTFKFVIFAVVLQLAQRSAQKFIEVYIQWVPSYHH